MHSTIFAGVDVAGESLRGFTNPDEHFFLLSYSQGYGITRYAQRYADWTYEIQEFKEKEKTLGIRYICVYPAEYILSLKNDRPELFRYIRDNYHVKEGGMIEEPRHLFYLILEKGKGAGREDFMESISGQIQLRRYTGS